MKISWNCLNQLIDLKNINHLEVIHKLTLAGFEIENIIKNKNINDIIFDLNITANRQDINSLIDIAIEISAIIEIPLKINYATQSTYTKNKLEVIQIAENQKFDYFNKISFCIIQNKNPKFNYQSVSNYLIAYDLKPRNYILDIIHFVNIKWGQKMKIYTTDSCNKKNITNFHFSLQSNNVYYNLSTNNKSLDNKSLIEINNENIQHYHDLETIILMTYEKKNHNIKTINSICDQYLLQAYKEIFYLLDQDNIINPIIYIKNNNTKKIKPIICRIDKINNVLGPSTINHKKQALSNDKIIKILQQLNFQVTNKQNQLQIHVPQTRIRDIQKEIDIIEEIGRIYGFDTFRDTLPFFNTKSQLSERISVKQKIRKILRSIGLHEVINYSIYNQAHTNHIALVNPLNKDQTILRTNLINNLIISKVYNSSQSNHLFEVFEIGKIFLKNLHSSQYNEYSHIAGLLGNAGFNRFTWNHNAYELNWFQAKGHLEDLFERINAEITWSKYAQPNYITQNMQKYTHPKRTIYMLRNKKVIGVFSQLNNRIAQSLSGSYKIYFFEINLDQLIKTIKTTKHLKYIYTTYSQYPKVIRDITIKIDNHISMQYIKNIVSTIKKNNNKFLESVIILNEYCNTQDMKTISLRTTYRSKHTTLTNEDIKILDNIFKQSLSFALKKI
uniref:phenylalanine--tRNA ligase n=1 Tax=Calliarthron tuberculosum TaxID=48942 RepID=M4ITP1_CALTB|nr:phenylalanine tRNA synthetase [Calliarthron tuberculosum]AGA63786.1 phenylalanine tRNA synthetase [Calliarthron tuberculosum]